MGLTELKEYNEVTTINGIMMTNIEDFNKKLELAIELWPQTNETGRINYLFGKGVGVELALRGTVEGRIKNNNNFPFRTHSDFEIYNAYDNNYDNMPDTIAFKEVFGAQEIYPKTYTKGLKNIENDLMDNNYEIVSYNNKEYLIPNLEILFLDKLLKKESTPRNEGYDAVLLLQEYNLDLNLIIDYLNKYYFVYQKEQKYEQLENALELQISAIENYIIKINTEYEPKDKQELEEILNNELNNYRGYKQGTKVFGINIDFLPETIKIENKEENYILSQQTKEEIKNLIQKEKDSIIEQFNSIENDIKNLYLAYNKSNSKNI